MNWAIVVRFRKSPTDLNEVIVQRIRWLNTGASRSRSQELGVVRVFPVNQTIWHRPQKNGSWQESTCVDRPFGSVTYPRGLSTRCFSAGMGYLHWFCCKTVGAWGAARLHLMRIARFKVELPATNFGSRTTLQYLGRVTNVRQDSGLLPRMPEETCGSCKCSRQTHSLSRLQGSRSGSGICQSGKKTCQLEAPEFGQICTAFVKAPFIECWFCGGKNSSRKEASRHFGKSNSKTTSCKKGPTRSQRSIRRRFVCRFL